MLTPATIYWFEHSIATSCVLSHANRYPWAPDHPAPRVVRAPSASITFVSPIRTPSRSFPTIQLSGDVQAFQDRPTADLVQPSNFTPHDHGRDQLHPWIPCAG